MGGVANGKLHSGGLANFKILYGEQPAGCNVVIFMKGEAPYKCQCMHVYDMIGK